MKNKKILMISPFALPNMGGVESHIDKLIKVARNEDFDITLITYQPVTTRARGKSYEKHENLEIIRQNWFGHNWFNVLEHYFPLVFIYLFPGLFVRSFIYFIKNKKSIDCIHAHGFVGATIARILKIISGTRIVMSTHAIYHFMERPILRFFIFNLLKGFDKVLAVSEVSRDELIAMGLKPDDVAVYPSWVDVDEFDIKDDKVYEKYSFEQKMNVFFAGRLIELKGVGVLLDAAKELEDIGFHFAGTGPLENSVSVAAEEHPNIYYHGSLDQSIVEQKEKLIELFGASDYFVSPYLYDEGFSSTLMESVACGTPNVVPNRGSPPTFLDDSVAVFLPRDVTVNSLIRKLKELDSNYDEDVRRKNQKICRKYTLEHFGPSNAKVILDSYSYFDKDKVLEPILSKVGDLSFGRRVREIVKDLNIQKEDRVLDVGCGEGFYSMVIGNLYGCKVDALDYDSKILELARKRLKNLDNIKIHQGSIYELPFEDSTFDKIICTEVIEHLDDDLSALEELLRVLKPGGFGIITVPNANYPLCWDPLNKTREILRLGHFDPKNRFLGGVWSYDHKRLYTPKGLESVVSRAGFKPTNTRTLTRFGIPFNIMLLNLGKIFYTTMPVPEDVKKNMEKFDWDKGSSNKSEKSLFSFLLGFGFSVLKVVDRLNDRELSLDAPSMTVYTVARKENK